MSQLSPNGVLLVDKPAGITSHTAVAMTRRAFDLKKVGHAGTLDPMATGLLVLGVGPSTRLLTYIVGATKRYRATIALGQTTVTDDAEGEVLTQADASALTEEQVLEAMQPFLGVIQQVPSAVSAIKVDGQRSYARVRAGEMVELAAREVTVTRFEALAFRQGVKAEVDVVVDCSSGTYIRALARDLGAALQLGGHLTALRRTMVGDFAVDDALSGAALEAAAAERGSLSTEQLLTPLAAAKRCMPIVELSEQDARLLAHGRRVPAPSGATGTVGTAYGERLLGVAEVQGKQLVVTMNLAAGGTL